LEYKRNKAGKFLQLTAIKPGKRSFVIFPAGWKGRGWIKIFEALNEIINPLRKSPRDVSAKSSAQGPLLVSALPPPPPLGCCPKCGFSGELMCFLRTSGQAFPSGSIRPAVTEVRDPSSSKAKQVNRGREEGSALFNRFNSSAGGTLVCSSSEPPSVELHGRAVEDGKASNFSPPDALLVLSSYSFCSEAKDFLDPPLKQHYLPRL